MALVAWKLRILCEYVLLVHPLMGVNSVIEVSSLQTRIILRHYHGVGGFPETFIYRFSMSLDWKNLGPLFALVVSVLSYLSCVVSFDILEVLLLLYDEFGELLLQRLALREELLVGELIKNLLLFLIIIFSFPLSSTLLLLWVVIGVRLAQLFFLLSLVVPDELLVVLVGNCLLVVKLLDIDFVQEMGDDVMIKIRVRVVVYQPLFVSVKDHHEDIEVAQHRQLHQLLNGTSFSLAYGHLSLIDVLD